MTPGQIPTLSVPDLDAAVIAKCKALREVEGRASRNWRPEHGEAGPGALICTGLDGGSYWLFAYHGGLPGPGIDLQFRFAQDRKLATAARNSFVAHLDAMEALAGWRCGVCGGSGRESNWVYGQSPYRLDVPLEKHSGPCPSCASIVTIKRKWLGKMEALG